MALPNTQIKTGWYFHRPSSTFLDLYLGPQLSYIWRYIHREFIQYAEVMARENKNWLYAFKKSSQTMASELGYSDRKQVSRYLKQLEAKGVLCRIPCASNNNQGKAIVTFDPASEGYSSFVYDVVGELKKKLGSGVMAKSYLDNFMSDINLHSDPSGSVNSDGQSVGQAMSIIQIPDDRPMMTAKKVKAVSNKILDDEDW